MINLAIAEILYLHEKLIQKTGGMSGIRDLGMLVMLMTLKINQISLEYTQQELICLALSAADGSMDMIY